MDVNFQRAPSINSFTLLMNDKNFITVSFLKSYSRSFSVSRIIFGDFHYESSASKPYAPRRLGGRASTRASSRLGTDESMITAGGAAVMKWVLPQVALSGPSARHHTRPWGVGYRHWPYGASGLLVGVQLGDSKIGVICPAHLTRKSTLQ